MSDTFTSKYYFDGIQDMGEEGKYRRYVLYDYLKSNKGNSQLLKEARNIFTNIRSFDGFHIHEIFFQFSVLPEPKGLYDVHVSFDNDFRKNERYIDTLIKCIDFMGLFLQHSVVWTYTDKQHARKNLNSWKKEVLKDDVCACCGGTKHLEAHHIFGFANNEELRDDPNNGIALCKWCHKKYHSYYPGDANPKDLIDFFKRFGGNHGSD